MKFCLNGGLLLGTVGMSLKYFSSTIERVMIVSSDGANIEIAEEVGNFYTFFKLFANNFIFETLGRRKQRL